MSGKRFTRTTRGERIDQPDFQMMAETSPRDAVNQVLDKVIVGDDANAKSWVLSGFDATSSGTQITVNRGVGVFGFRADGEVLYGAVSAEGPASKTIDIGGLNDGTYGIYVRLELTDAGFQNRLIWDEAATPDPKEEAKILPTRRTEDWSIIAATSAPGPEWCEIYTAAKSGASAPLTDARNFFFEGRASNSYQVVDAAWGGGNDRNADRALYGVKGLRRTVRALQRQIQDLIGDSWWTATSGKLARDGSQTMLGDLTVPSEDFALGTSGVYWLDAFLSRIWGDFATLGARLLGTAANAMIARLNIPGSATQDRTLLLQSFMGGSASAATMRVYRSHVASGTTSETDLFEVTKNCYYDNNTNDWKKDDSGQPSTKAEFSAAHFLMLRRSSAGPFGDDAWDLPQFFRVNIDTGDVIAGGRVHGVDVEADTGEYVYGVAKTGRRLILPSQGAFIGTWGPTIYGMVIKAGTSDTVQGWWGLPVPDGATLTKVYVRGDFLNGGGGWTVRVVQRAKGSGTEVAIGGPNSPSGAAVDADVTISPPVIVDVVANTYYLHISCSANGDTGEINTISAEWTTTQVRQ